VTGSDWKNRTFSPARRNELEVLHHTGQSEAVVSVASTTWLSRFVEDVRVIEPAVGQSHELQWLPDGRTLLLLRVIEEGRQGDVSVAGPRTRAQFKDAAGVARAIIVQFKPGWSAPLVGVPGSALTDRIIPLEQIWGRAGIDLCHELVAVRSVPAQLDRLSRAIALHMHETFEPRSALLARRAARLLEGGETRVESVAKRLGVTPRHLRRAFTESIGIGPKEFARAVRLQRAVRRSATSRDWGRIATDTGYYDQAHLIADFRELIGLTPSSYRQRASGLPLRSSAVP
jgi:AraC-like DNA-binding protein